MVSEEKEERKRCLVLNERKGTAEQEWGKIW
jgi:hypothetical protein